MLHFRATLRLWGELTRLRVIPFIQLEKSVHDLLWGNMEVDDGKPPDFCLIFLCRLLDVVGPTLDSDERPGGCAEDRYVGKMVMQQFLHLIEQRKEHLGLSLQQTGVLILLLL